VIAPGAIEWGRGSEMGDWAISSRGANAIYGSGRKRRHTLRHVRRRQEEMKTCRLPHQLYRQPALIVADTVSRKQTRRRRHRGGDKYGSVSASYQGTGSRGMIDVAPTTTRYPDSGRSSVWSI
jgi:hypothetical protein